MTGPSPGPDAVVPEGAAPDALLDAIVRRAAELDGVGPAPLRRLRLRAGATSIEIEWHAHQVPAPPAPLAVSGTAAAVPAPEPVAVTGAEDETFPMCAPAVGTFYRAPEPGAAPFVDVGDTVSPGQQIGIIEAMKLMNPVEADRAGRVVRVAVGNGEAVEFGQTLLVLTPAGDG